MNNSQIYQLIQQLQQPEFYPHSVEVPIKVIQTHISVVFLTGDYAYKIKKPVDFGFLDFSTLAKRQYFLEQELELNRGLSPEIYLEVLPITVSGDRLSLNGTTEPIEYVLKMQQFPQDCLLINLFENNQLTEEHLKELAKVVADFHFKTATNDYITKFGTVETIKKSVDHNYELTERYIDIAQTQEQYQATKDFTDSFFSAKKELFSTRQQQGKIKDCHGDLHLKNICLWNNKIHLFDRIEFNEDFRFIDVISEIAFTVMDLEARKRQDLSNLFLNNYLEYTGDWEGLNVLPLYLTRQAYVRAKVTSMLLDDPNISPQEKEKAIQTAKEYYQLAWEYTQPRQGCIILMSGLSGSGKTTVAQYLAQRINAIHIRSDAVRKHLAEIPLTETGTEDLYSSQSTQQTYNRLLELGEMLAFQGFKVILDAKFDRIYWREKAIKWAQTNQISLYILHCYAPLETLRDRLDQRQGDISDATSSLLQQQQAMTEPFNDTEQTFVISLDTSKNWQTQLNLILT
ncbi:conserved hypothetical protein [Rippkaea orientalis PCC 8801]|uniref:gluconokinase n=1 Tax=Rippkaea orientalis (strain PCC 8801 / RF-1) TaxID=41431 RepID=B7JUV6_RIPO1|nr:AAA family ATPase [Rippkaea orientalis]ACK66808.1 conserved hypothetical protein [Rippkaea orientalis PCC 8801]